MTMNNQYLIDWSKWQVRVKPITNDVDIHAPIKCLMSSCVNGCIGHTVSPTPLQPGFTQYATSAAQNHGAALALIMRRGVKSRRSDYRDAIHAFSFKGMASRSFV